MGEATREFEAFFQRTYLPLCRYLYGILGNLEDTSEVAQESFLRHWQNGAAVEDERGRTALLYRLAHNLAIDLVRRNNVRKRSVETVRQNVIRMPVTPEQVTMNRQRIRQAEEALARLDERQRECLRLRAAGLTYAQIGATLELSPESVGPLLTRALRRVRTLREEFDQPASNGGDDAATR
jgi:RNA polymerase sigma-70 factor (ECF subfamily)